VEVMDIFQRLNKRGITVVIVTHEPDIASYTNRNITFKDGKIQKDIFITKPKIASEELLSLPVLSEEETI
jgi:putative ABC transport system ATP-binding protein